MTAYVRRATGLRRGRLLQLGAVAVAVTLLALGALTAFAVPPGHPAFQRTWERTDKPVADGAVARTWMWGDQAFTNVIDEDYAEAPGGTRQVQYYDKSRMEINDPEGDQSTPWFVTNGLLVVEMVSGQVQVGDNSFENRAAPANIPVAGDPDDPNGPTYGTIAEVLDRAPVADGSAIIQRLARDGTVTDDPSLAGQGVTAAHQVQVPGINHRVANVFWAFMNSTGTVYENGQLVTDQLFENAFYATGYPITEAYWARVKVDARQRDVLMQCFERRCLTYTPDNDPGWRVEAGNVGRHYYSWVYDSAVTPTPTVTVTPTETPEPLPDESLFVAYLSGDNEQPDPVETDATGVAYFHVMEDGSAIEFKLSVNDIQNVTAAHIHMGGPEETGDIVAPLFMAPSGGSVTPNGVLREGRVEADDLPAGMSIAELAQLLADGEAYVNVHTTANEAGEIRGQIAEVGTTAFNADLQGANEIPAVDTEATGTTLFLYDAEAGEIDYDLSVFDIDGVTAAHIHEGKSNENGPVVALLFGASSPVNPTNGRLARGTIDAGDVQDMSVERVVYLMLTGNAYVNVHTTAHPDGEIRGQVGIGPGIDYPTESTFVAELRGENQNPPVTTSASGQAVISFNEDGSLDYTLIVANLDDPEAAHIHVGGPDINGPVILPLWDDTMGPAIENGVLAQGTVAPDEADLATLLYQMLTGDTYVNVHTEDHPDGEIRGQLALAPGEVFLAVLTDDAVVFDDSLPPLVTGASGVALFQVNAARDEIAYTIVVDDLDATTAIVLYQGAIDESVTSANAIATLYEDDPLNDPAPPTEGVITDESIVVGEIAPPPTTVEELIATMAAGETYVQVHTVDYQNPAGELRGHVEQA